MNKNILLVGRPNAGKSTIFNYLTGQFRRKMANYSGASVDIGQGEVQDLEEIKIFDLPGIYSFEGKSLEEKAAIDFIHGPGDKRFIYILDGASPTQALSFYLQFQEKIGKQVPIIISKSALLQTRKHLDIVKLEKQLNTPIFIFDEKKGENDTKLIKIFLEDWYSKYSQKALEGPKQKQQKISLDPGSLPLYEKKARELVASYLDTPFDAIKKTHKLDSLLTNSFIGPIIFILIFYGIFHLLYTLSAPFMEFIEIFFESLSSTVSSKISNPFIGGLLGDGILAGVGSIVIFLPQIIFLFFLLTLLEQSGLLARASLLSDKVMAYFGLSGKAFLPYLSGLACSIPAIMATRTISNKKERLITILTIPLITCSARLPVYLLLIGTFIPTTTVFYFFDSRALALFALYFTGSISALIMAKFFKLTLFKEKSSSFIIDLPLYRSPSIKDAFKIAWNKGLMFLKKAGTTILCLSMVIWFLSNYPSPPKSLIENKSGQEIAAISLENSYIGKVGKFIEPVFIPIGMDWKIGVGILIAFGARELFVTAMGTLYAISDHENTGQILRERIMADRNHITNKKTYSTASFIAILMFFVFACQCLSTLAIIKAETKSYLWPTLVFAYSLVMAYSASFITYQLLS